MLVSLNEIKKYVSLDGLSAEQIADGLTFAGVEVEEVRTLASGTNLTIGYIKECKEHPNSDHLHILKVDLGKYGEEQIVCGAPNARAGLKVIVARVGAKLPGGEIKAGVIRGESSNGMCCSLLELGVEDKYLSEASKKGIEELDNDAPVGSDDVLGYLHLDDKILNLKVLANRPDLLSIYNVAYEIGAIFNREVKIPHYEEIKDFATALEVGSETDKCSQFSGKEIKGIKIKESPKWLKEALMSMGVRSINNIVDIGNYVMLLTGQPLHMYDADKLPKAELIARSDYQGPFVALDEKTYEIKENDIVITSNRVPMCLGGVMGSLACAVDENTTHIYIESASFDGATIRRTSNRLGLASESSSRFVKGTNHFQSVDVINFASYLIKELCEGQSFSNIKIYQKEEYQKQVIKTSAEKINNRLGTSFTLKEIVEVLTRLHFVCKGDLEVEVPQFRLDVYRDADISEEVIRLLGYQHVKSILPVLDVKVGTLTLEQNRLRNIRYFLLDKGLDECLTYSLVSDKEINKFNLINNDEHYRILNPLTDDRVNFRKNLAHSLLNVANYNISRQNKDLALFETSHIQTKAHLEEHLSILLVGNQSSWGQLNKTPYDFYHMKGLIEGLMEMLGIGASRYKFNKLSSHLDELHPGKSAELVFQNKVIGVFGELHPNMYAEYGLGKTNAVVLEMKLDDLLSAKVSINKMTPISKFPYVQRDLAFLVDKDVEVKDIIKTIKMMGKGINIDAEVFDVYEGKNILSHKKSVAISIYYQKDDATLLDKEVSEIEDQIKFELTRIYHAELRG